VYPPVDNCIQVPPFKHGADEQHEKASENYFRKSVLEKLNPYLK